MRDQLLDIVQHTTGLGFDIVKLTQKNNETTMLGNQNKNSLIMYGKFKDPLPFGMDCVIGMPDLNKLSVILNIPMYMENPKIEIVKEERNGVLGPTKIAFSNDKEDFNNEYRLMAERLVNTKIPDITFTGADWHVEIQPSQLDIQRFKFQKNANSEEFIFNSKLDGDNLVFEFGDHSTHSGGFVFHKGVTGKMTKTWQWPVAHVNNILSLPGDLTMRFSDGGMLEMEVETNWAKYQYLIPAQGK